MLGEQPCTDSLRKRTITIKNLHSNLPKIINTSTTTSVKIAKSQILECLRPCSVIAMDMSMPHHDVNRKVELAKEKLRSIKNQNRIAMYNREDLLSEDASLRSLCHRLEHGAGIKNIPSLFILIYLVDFQYHSTTRIKKPYFEESIYSLLNSFFTSQKDNSEIEKKIHLVVIFLLEKAYDTGILFSKSEKIEYDKRDKLLWKNCSVRMSVRFLVRYIMNYQKLIDMHLFQDLTDDTKRKMIIYINKLLRYIEENDIVDGIVESYDLGIKGVPKTSV